ncbi:MAG: 30S ribosomal protein S4 [Candidatus Bathyarchaeia archaeon]
MGDPKKQRKKYETPLHPWRRDQLDIELKLVGEYGLRNKRELWKYKTMLSKIRGIARSLLAKSIEEREKIEKQYLKKLSSLGLVPENPTLDDVLDMDIKNLLERRLQTIVYRIGLARSIYEARQLITHGHIAIGNRIVRVPSYLVKKVEEQSIAYALGSPLNKPDHPIKALATVKPSGKANKAD